MYKNGDFDGFFIKKTIISLDNNSIMYYKFLMKLIFSLFLFFPFLSCAGISGFFTNSIRGKITPIWTDHSYQGQFQFVEHSHAIIELYVEEHSESNSTVSKHEITPITAFPIKYSIPYPNNVDEKDLRISVKVISGKGDKLKIGDFHSEEVTPVNKKGFSTDIKVVGIENCSDAHAGGFCLNK